MKTSPLVFRIFRTMQCRTFAISLTCLVGGLWCAQAQDGAAILQLLVQKGLITEVEAQALIEEAKQAQPVPTAVPEPASAPVPAEVAAPKPQLVIPTAKGSPLEKLTFSGRLQAQFAHIKGDIGGTPDDPSTVNHFFLRRVYFGTKAQLTEDFTGVVTYDFSAGSFDAAYVGWKPRSDLEFKFGLTKVPFAVEEHLVSSGSLKAIERSAVTRYFVEPNNGRRLGAGVYRNGIFMDGNQGNWVYRLAVTNPERVTSPGSAGSSINNVLAPWGFFGYRNASENGHLLTGLELGYLPEQGGKDLGTGNNLTVAAALLDFSHEKFSLLSEFMLAHNELGASETEDADPWGFFVQPSYRFSKQWEGVVRFSYVDSDGRGISLSDAVRSAPSGGTMDRLYEGYLGGNWYVIGDNLKLQAGLVYGKSKDLLNGEPAEAEAYGFRSMVQLQY